MQSHSASIPFQPAVPTVGNDLKTGTIIKLVSSFGSAWGRIQPIGEERRIFFNRQSMELGEFATLALSDIVEFEEERDLPNESRAIHVHLKPMVASVNERGTNGRREP